MSRDTLARLAAVAAGVWLMFAPAVLHYDGVPATNDRIVGPIAASFAFVACWQVVMPLRWATIPFGAWLVVAPLALGFDPVGAWVSSILAGVVVVATAFVGRDLADRFDGGWRSVRPAAWSEGS